MTWQVVGEASFALGESPFWHPQEKCLYGVDIPGGLIWRTTVLTGDTETWATPSVLGEPACIAPVYGGGLAVAMRTGIYRAREWRGELEPLALAPYDTATQRFNDGKADPQGRFWSSTYCEDRLPRAHLYVLDARALAVPVLTVAGVNLMPGRVGAAGLTNETGVTDVTGGNGLAWSPDGTVLYWADTAAHVVRAWNWDGHFNTLTHGRVFHEFDPKPPGWAYGAPGFQAYQGRPDGAAVDVEGNYWVAMYEGGCIKKLSPAGQVLATIAVPALCPTMPCFGGDDLQTLYLTTARKGRSAHELAALPLSGRVLSMRVEVPGLPVNFFAD